MPFPSFTPQDRRDIEAWFTPAPCSAAKLDRMGLVRESAIELLHTIYTNCPLGADRSAAVRSIREAVMTVNHAISYGGHPNAEEYTRELERGAADAS